MSKLHGPVITTPEAMLGSASASDCQQNHDSTDEGNDTIPAGGGIQNDGAKEIIKGVQIISQTQSGLVIDITPEAVVWTTSFLKCQL